MKKDYGVEQYLNDLKVKIKFYDLIIVQREKNRSTMAELEIY